MFHFRRCVRLQLKFNLLPVIVHHNMFLLNWISSSAEVFVLTESSFLIFYRNCVRVCIYIYIYIYGYRAVAMDVIGFFQ
jgi:hypothetical protein